MYIKCQKEPEIRNNFLTACYNMVLSEEAFGAWIFRTSLPLGAEISFFTRIKR